MSKGSAGRAKLSDAQFAWLERELERGPLAQGWPDQRWTLARVKMLIGRLFHVSYTLEGTWRLLKRNVWSWQQPARRAIERDEEAIDEPKGFGWQDFRGLLIRARNQLGGRIVLVWDNVRLHLTAGLREFIAANASWHTVFQLPPYAPDLNPQEGIWSLVKSDLGNLAAADLADIRAVNRRLKQIQYRPDVVDGCLTGTGLITDG
ncbi:winged helix-turn-helix domain-containing protein [Streptomyces platensis]|uniref:winged helix-turn-helix domain-containing protein n=1 Tax=Streptomyces platensis TaxID=58346 RepID=UPI00368840B6